MALSGSERREKLTYMASMLWVYVEHETVAELTDREDSYCRDAVIELSRARLNEDYVTVNRLTNELRKYGIKIVPYDGDDPDRLRGYYLSPVRGKIIGTARGYQGI